MSLAPLNILTLGLFSPSLRHKLFSQPLSFLQTVSLSINSRLYTGIAFDVGKLLSTPELVPFRLTQEMVDGMGILGVEGIFRRCCEQVLRVLRRERSAIVTVVEVLKHDPLYHW